MPFSQEEREIVLRGLPISKGIGIGSPVFLASTEEVVESVSISHKEVDREIDRYRRALALSQKDVEQLHKLSLDEGPPESAAILGTHLEMMKDPLMTVAMEEKIRHLQQNTESIFRHLVEEYKERFSTLQDSYFQERVRDIVDVSRRILFYLGSDQSFKIRDLPQNSILLAHELVPSETVEANGALVAAFITGSGGLTSHAAIIARAKGIPYVANIDIKTLKKTPIRSLIVDGSQGLVILNPTRKTLKKYQQIQKSYKKLYKELKSSSRLKGETIDGYEVRLFANLENPAEISLLKKQGASGVGLFRSEYLFLSRRAFPSEEEQFHIYREMALALKKAPFVIRIFDVGGEKRVTLPPNHPDAKYFAEIGPEVNPALGCRAIRFLLRHPELLDRQLRAIVRASAFGEIHLLIPMVSDVSELYEVRRRVEAIQQEMRQKGVKIASEIPIGCMIEVPSSVIMCDALIEASDFLSIGTNDLIQYVLATDRGNAATSQLYFSTHPSILRLIRMVVGAANQRSKPVILCGESAADPTLIPLLVGLGIREFSVASRHIPLVKHTLRKWRLVEACRLAEEALSFSSSEDLKGFLMSQAVR